jgi:cyclic pyranopterin phosphate synthase
LIEELDVISGTRMLQDGFGRRLEYLRLSVTDRCNFRCSYCLPDGCPRGSGAEPLSVAEIGRLVRAFAALGVWKVRLTGGEPTMRGDIPEIVRAIAAVPGVRRIGLTTNGYRLATIAPELRAAGLSSVNVSLDSLEPARFERITGCSRLDRIVEGVEAAAAAGIPSVKMNAVLLRGMDDRELDLFLAWTRGRALTVRFIELMETGENQAYFREHHLPAEEIRRKLEARGWARLPRDPNDGPAIAYGHPAHRGEVGLIAPYSPGFCETCNRVRVSSTGDLRLCLFGGDDVPLRPYLQSDDGAPALTELIQRSVGAKPASHQLREGSPGATRTLAVIGG